MRPGIRFLRATAIAIGGVGAFAIGAVLWPRTHLPQKPALVYTAEGYGGMIAPSVSGPRRPADPLTPAVEAMSRHSYGEAQRAASLVLQAHAGKGDARSRTLRARANMVMAYATARRKDLATARERFALAQREAAGIEATAAPVEGPFHSTPRDLEAQAAFQHAVCTAALGRRDDAIAEYVAIMRRYPGSPEVQASVRRVAAMHGGDLRPEIEKERVAAERVALRLQQQAKRERSLCGAECLAEVLRRRGRKADVRALADEMKTTHEGASVAALLRAAERRGLKPKGLLVTLRGLKQQPLPAIALVAPGHFVLIQSLNSHTIEIWDPDGAGPGRPSSRHTGHADLFRSGTLPVISLVKPLPGGSSDAS